MANPSVPPIDLLGARATFGLGGGGGGLLDLLRTPGGVVPGSSRNLAVPTAAPIGLLSLLGTENVNYQMGNGGSYASVAVGTANASFQLSADAFAKRGENGVITNMFQWLLAGGAANVDAYAELLSGTAPGGSAINTWINCAGSPAWTKVQSGTGVTQCVLRIHLASAGTGVSTTSGTWELYAEKSA